MEWMWAAISVFWTLGAWVVATTTWATARRWNEMGVIDNGVSVRLERGTQPVGFALAHRGMQFVALLGLIFVAIGIAITIGWIMRAL